MEFLILGSAGRPVALEIMPASALPGIAAGRVGVGLRDVVAAAREGS
ncbi:hypothetical protein [Nonomuraea sp. NPDC052265]